MPISYPNPRPMNRIHEIRWNVIQGGKDTAHCCQIDVDSLAADSVLEEVEKEAEGFC